jgi:hypothetical protein
MLEVLNLIFGIGYNSVGLDEFTLKFTKLFLHVVLPFITYIFNTAYTTLVRPYLFCGVHQGFFSVRPFAHPITIYVCG